MPVLRVPGVRQTKADHILLLCSWLSKNFPIHDSRETHIYIGREIKETIDVDGYKDVTNGKDFEILGCAGTINKEKQIFVKGTISMYQLEDTLCHEWTHHRRCLDGSHDDQFWLEYGRIYRERTRWMADDNYARSDFGVPISDKFKLHIDKSLGLKFSRDWSKV